MMGASIISKTLILRPENSAMQSKLEIIAFLYMNSNITFKTADMILKHRNILDKTLVLYQKKLKWPRID